MSIYCSCRLLTRSFAVVLLILGVASSESASAQTIFGSGPQTEAADLPVFDPTDYELGTVFNSSVDGEITALRIYLGPVEASDAGAIFGTLWDASGSVLGTAGYGPIVAGWNEIALTTSVSITANTTYVVSANTNAGTTGTGSYAVDKGPSDLGFFVGGGFASGPLTATTGVFNTTIGAFPADTFPSTNGGSSYFRDVQFTAVPEPSSALLVGLGLAALTRTRSAHRRRIS